MNQATLPPMEADASFTNDEMTDKRQSSSLISHNITISGRRTSIRLEKETWLALKDIARREHCKIHDLCSHVYKRKRKNSSLTAAIRVFSLVYYRDAATEQGHLRAGHGCGPTIAARTIEKNIDTPYYGLREFKYLPPDRLQ